MVFSRLNAGMSAEIRGPICDISSLLFVSYDEADEFELATKGVGPSDPDGDDIGCRADQRRNRNKDQFARRALEQSLREQPHDSKRDGTDRSGRQRPKVAE